MNTPWRQAIINVMKMSQSAMHYTQIAEAIITQKLRDSIGATPAATVNATITSDLKQNGDSSVFVRVNPGEYILRAGVSTVTKVPPPPKVEHKEAQELQEEEELGIIQAFGMFWRRDIVLWNNATRLLGQQQQGAQHVDFASQIGVYLLHDGRDVIYVGRATDRPLGRRLFEHTYDRLNGRWNRFSWFGLLRVTPKGVLVEPSWTRLRADQLIATMEAILIEGLEPPQNRRRGDEFKGIEYLQVKDPRLQKRELSALFEELKGKLETD